MNQCDELVHILEHSRANMLTQLEEIDKKRQIYPLWTIREMLAHLCGWDDAVIAFLQSLIAGNTPATPAERGVDMYNAETVATREGLDYDHVYHEYIETRKVLLKLLKGVPDEKLNAPYILPWGDPGTLVDIIHIFGPHENEHANDIAKLISQNQQSS